MPTYAQLASEPEWGAQFTPPAMNAGLLGPLRVFYGLGPSSVGAAGDNNHLYGRHRSYAWDDVSRYCTNPRYGTTDGRDQGGNRDWYRACDVGITGQALYDASHRIDALVRSGGAPGIAEWFGTFDGQTVVGWFEGRPSTSDDSHLYHLHIGFWNESADNAALMQLVYATITGTGPATPQEDDMMRIARDPSNDTRWIGDGVWRRQITQQEVEDWIAQGVPSHGDSQRIYTYGRDVAVVDAILAAIEALPPGSGTAAPSIGQISAAMRTELDRTQFNGQLSETPTP